MSIEIERKFLVLTDAWRNRVSCCERQRQGYLSKTSRASVRVRCSYPHAMITIKSARRGCVREEFEYPIPIGDAEDILRRLCVHPIIEKVRHWVEHAGMVWHVDEYCAAAAAGLVLAEIELDRPDQVFVLPDWAGAEVTHDLRYRNSAIAKGSLRINGPEIQPIRRDKKTLHAETHL
jgi:adenylate cyclase